jgi:acetyl-CoA acyltransferase 1
LESCFTNFFIIIITSLTSEAVAKEYGLTREDQDAFAVLSHKRAAAAQAAGYFKDEIVPLTVTVLDKNGENPKQIVVDKDEGIRANSTLEGLGKLKPAFTPTGSTTAGNASQISDGASAVLLMKRKVAQKLNLPILGKYVTAASVGVPPRVMVRKKKIGLTTLYVLTFFFFYLG